MNANIGKKEKPKPAPSIQKQKTTAGDNVKLKVHDKHKLKKPNDKIGQQSLNKDKHKTQEGKHGKRSDGKHSDGKHLDGKRSDGKRSDGKHSVAKHSDGKRSDGKRLDGKHSDGKLKNDASRQSENLKGDKHKNEHRKEKERIAVKNSDIKIKKKKKPSNSNNNGLNFNDLMKFAKLNSENPGSGAIQKQKEELEKKTKSKPQSGDPFDPDRNLKVNKPVHSISKSNSRITEDVDRKKHSVDRERLRTQNKHHVSDRNPNPKRKHEGAEFRGGSASKQFRQSLENKNLHVSRQKDIRNGARPSSHHQPKVASKDISNCEVVEPQRRGGLVVETVSVSKSNGGKMKRPISNMHSGKDIQGINRKQGPPMKHRNGGGGGGIEAQFRSSQVKKPSSNKKKAEDFENEFEKEERMLARKRKLFEMRRVTGLLLK